MDTQPVQVIGTCSLCGEVLYRHTGWINNPVMLEDGTEHTHDRPFEVAK